MPEHRDRMTRRLFNAHLACGALSPLALAQEQASNGETPKNVVQTGPNATKRVARIAGLELLSSQPIDVMKRFYARKLGFEVERENRHEIRFRTGVSSLTFKHSPNTDAFYHFAFNIPENQIKDAFNWQRERTELIMPPAHLNDSDMPREIVAFRHWSAHSIFFWDPAGNAVEFIARHDLSNASDRPFSARSAICLSEIGLVVRDVPQAASHLKKALSLQTYVSASPEFEPIGDQHGLLLLMKIGRPMAFGKGRTRAVYQTGVRLVSPSANATLKSYPYEFAE